MQSRVVRWAGCSQHRPGAYAGRQGDVSAGRQGQPNQKCRKSWPEGRRFAILTRNMLAVVAPDRKPSVLRRGSQAASAKCCQAREFLSFAFGMLGKIGRKCLAGRKFGTAVWPAVSENSIFRCKIQYSSGISAYFATAARFSLRRLLRIVNDRMYVVCAGDQRHDSLLLCGDVFRRTFSVILR
jgi:hypothetical protein